MVKRDPNSELLKWINESNNLDISKRVISNLNLNSRT